MSIYQVMPDLCAEEYRELKEDIAARGVMVPVEFDEAGNVLDGHHRLRACAELGITDYPKVIRPGMTEAEKRIHARKLNMARRHLTRDQRQELIREQLKETPERSDRQIAAGLGVSHVTVGARRAELESTGQIDQLDTNVGADGKVRPRRPIAIYNPSPAEVKAMQNPAVRAEIRAIEKLGLAEEVRRQKLEEAQMISEAVLDAEVRIGTLFKQMQTAQGTRTDVEPRSSVGTKLETKEAAVQRLGFGKTQVHRFETLARHPEIVEQAKAEARERDDIVSRAFVLQKVKEAKREMEATDRLAAIKAAGGDHGNQYTGGKNDSGVGFAKPTKAQAIESIGFTPKQVERSHSIPQPSSVILPPRFRPFLKPHTGEQGLVRVSVDGFPLPVRSGLYGGLVAFGYSDCKAIIRLFIELSVCFRPRCGQAHHSLFRLIISHRFL